MNRGELPTASWSALEFRAAVLRKLRDFFHQRAFVEVETPSLSRDTVVDLHLDPIPVVLFHDAREPAIGQRMWLQTSPEFAMKRLLAAGAERIFQVAKAFRGGESGAWHNPEFTMVEWYRVGDSYEEGMQLLADLAQCLLEVPRVERVSYEAAFLATLQLNPHEATADALRQAARKLGESPEFGDDRDAWLNFLLATHVEPRLGSDVPTILYDYPASQSALARTRRADSGAHYEVAERFELYYRGVELANGYHELLDPAVLRRRHQQANAARAADGRYVLPTDSRLLDAMTTGLPACSGCALGFDRLVALLYGATDLRTVLAFPIDRA